MFGEISEFAEKRLNNVGAIAVDERLREKKCIETGTARIIKLLWKLNNGLNNADQRQENTLSSRLPHRSEENVADS